MKSIDEIRKMSLDALEEISLAGGSPDIPADLASRSARLIRRQHRRRTVAGIAAGVAVFAVAGLGIMRGNALTDTFSDPYLAYAEIEKAFTAIGNTARSSATLVLESKRQYDETIDNIFSISDK